ncbi:MAG: hypothetical protein ACOX69_10985 [Coriobacteriales bacterium]
MQAEERTFCGDGRISTDSWLDILEALLGSEAPLQADLGSDVRPLALECLAAVAQLDEPKLTGTIQARTSIFREDPLPDGPAARHQRVNEQTGVKYGWLDNPMLAGTYLVDASGRCAATIIPRQSSFAERFADFISASTQDVELVVLPGDRDMRAACRQLDLPCCTLSAHANDEPSITVYDEKGEKTEGNAKTPDPALLSRMERIEQKMRQLLKTATYGTPTLYIEWMMRWTCHLENSFAESGTHLSGRAGAERLLDELRAAQIHVDAAEIGHERSTAPVQ